MSPDLILAIVGAGGFSAVFASVFTGWLQRKKLGAEATKIITDAAGGMVDRLQVEVISTRQEVTRLRQEVERLGREADERDDRHEMAWREHAAKVRQHMEWDREALRLHPDLPPPPDFYPPERRL